MQSNTTDIIAFERSIMFLFKFSRMCVELSCVILTLIHLFVAVRIWLYLNSEKRGTVIDLKTRFFN